MSNKTASAIVVYRRADYIGLCLDSLNRQEGGVGEVIVIDNSLDPLLTESLKARYPEVRWLTQEKNLSYSEALNLGISQSRGEFILCLNDDVRLSADYVAVALKGFARDPAVGMVSGKITRADNKILDSTGLFLSCSWTAKERGYGAKDSGQYEREGFVFGVTGAVGFYRRKMLDDIREKGSYFDPAFGYFYEDLDVAWRGQRKGWKAFYIPKARAAHVRGGTVRQDGGIGRWGARRFLTDDLHARLIRNRYLTIAKNGSARGFLAHLPFLVCYDIFAWAYVFLFRPRLIGYWIKYFVTPYFSNRLILVKKALWGYHKA